MPLLDHFHPPLRGPRRWEGFHHAWAANIAQHLNREVLPDEFFAESEISIGPTLEIDVADVELTNGREPAGTATATERRFGPPPNRSSLSRSILPALDVCEVRVYEDLGGSAIARGHRVGQPCQQGPSG